MNSHSRNQRKGGFFMFHDDEVVVEESKASLRAEARERARQDVRDERLSGEEAEEVFELRLARHYADLAEGDTP
jgi:hypothetical protein